MSGYAIWAMLWAALVASGVAIFSMTLFGAWITRRRNALSEPEEFVPSPDPSDPWAAYAPRPFDDADRRRTRLWPAVAGLVGLVLVGGGFAGARQNARIEAVETEVPDQAFVFEVESQTIATPSPSAVATAAPSAAPQIAAAAPKPSAPVAATAAGPTITGSVTCAAGSIKVSFGVSGSNLSWVALYVDKKVVKGGPISGTSFASSYTGTATPGDHEVEVSAEDRAGGSARKQFRTHCA